MTRLLLSLLFFGLLLTPKAQVRETLVANGWARNSVNTVIFRKNALYTHDSIQYIGFYDGDQNLVLGKRVMDAADWELHTTRYKGNARDAHNSISLIVDEDGYLHVSWDHHNTRLRYARSVVPHSLHLTGELPMLSRQENHVSYPEFYRLDSERLLFLYRSGESGNGNLIINRYDVKAKAWERLHENLISGESQRNAYWQVVTDSHGAIHLSWVWRESPDVASNHDLCYARSTDGGTTWTRSDGSAYELPVTATTAEYICRIPQRSELINQTSMTTDPGGNPVIASYWKPEGSDIPQYHIVFKASNGWAVRDSGFRKTPFSLSGAGTKAIPIARPQVVVSDQNKVYLIFRDAERQSRVSMASCQLPECNNWTVTDLTTEAYTSWEPALDPAMWEKYGRLDLFVQKVVQIDGEGVSETPPQPVTVLEWRPPVPKE